MSPEKRVKPEVFLGNRLRELSLTLASAESCTGGLLGSRITDVAGSSDYFQGGVIAYSNALKIRLLGVSKGNLKKYGAVSAPVAKEMALGARTKLKADVGAGITGIAGPTGGTPSKPVGTVFISVSTKKRTVAQRFLFKGSRVLIKRLSAEAAMEMLGKELDRMNPPRAEAQGFQNVKIKPRGKAK